MNDMNDMDELRICPYCDSFTGDSSTGCAGKLCNGKYVGCPSFSLDRITAPRWVVEELAAQEW